MKSKTETAVAPLAVISLDIGKEVFHLVGLGNDGKITVRKKVRRLDLKVAFKQLPPCIVGMEACLSAHFVSRTLRALGHEPRIIPAIYVKPSLPNLCRRN
jgi:transposase